MVWRVRGSNPQKGKRFYPSRTIQRDAVAKPACFSMERAVFSGFKLPGNEVYHSPASIAGTKNGKLDLYPLHMSSRCGVTFTHLPFAFTVLKNVCYFDIILST